MRQPEYRPCLGVAACTRGELEDAQGIEWRQSARQTREKN